MEERRDYWGLLRWESELDQYWKRMRGSENPGNIRKVRKRAKKEKTNFFEDTLSLLSESNPVSGDPT
ncbi:MAG: hypothetical protein UBAL2_86920195 [Leptospirillum rubarum]|nr:MAG: hypothetical protein UBAL2_86920195 [Leptospirillum rubarum]